MAYNNKMRFSHDLPSLYKLLASSAEVPNTMRDSILCRAAVGEGLTLEEAAVLLAAPPSWGAQIFEGAAEVNKRTNGKTVTFYGVVYIHDFCINDCIYCGDSIRAVGARRKILSEQEFVTDVQALLKLHPFKQICFLMGEDWLRFNRDQLIKYLQAISSTYREKIILNVPPLTVKQFSKIREALPNVCLQFRVFQETYDSEIYGSQHLGGPKVDFEYRVNSQARAIEAGFDEVGHGVLYGLNDKKNGHLFETLAMIAHAQDLHSQFGKRSKTMSFPRVLPAPNIDYHPASTIEDDTLIRCLSVAKLSDPQIDTIITCRETEAFRRHIRSIVNIEDFAARPGPGGNSIPETRPQMILPDMRSGEDIRREMINDGYTVQ